MASNPIFPLYYNDIYRSTRDWTDEEFGCYVRLLMHQWAQGEIPKDTQRLARIAPSISQNAATVLAKFVPTATGMVNERLEEIRAERAAFSKKQALNAKKRNIQPDSSQTTAKIEPKPSLHNEDEYEQEEVNEEKGVQGENPLQGSNLFRKPKVPNYEDVCRVFMQHGGTTEQAEAFYNKHTGTGWFLNGSPIVNYASLVPSFITNWKNNRQNGTTKILGKSAGAAKLAADLAADLQQRNAGRTQGAGSEV